MYLNSWWLTSWERTLLLGDEGICVATDERTVNNLVLLITIMLLVVPY